MAASPPSTRQCAVRQGPVLVTAVTRISAFRGGKTSGIGEEVPGSVPSVDRCNLQYLLLTSDLFGILRSCWAGGVIQ